MTIHMFDGFIWPGGLKRNPAKRECVSEFDFPSKYVNYFRVDAGNGLTHTSGSGTSSDTRSNLLLKTRKRIPHGNKIVVGCRSSFKVRIGNLYDSAFVFIKPLSDDSTLESSALVGSNGSIRVSPTSALPGLAYGAYQNSRGIALINYNTKETTTYNPLVETQAISPIVDLPGIDWANSTMYEVEYDFALNKILVYVDDALVIDFPYEFSEIQKQDSFWSLQCHNNGESPTITTDTRIECFYMADRRLGPVAVVDTNVDIEDIVDQAFGAPPYASKVTAASDGSSFISTKETARAMFDSSSVVDKEIVGVRVASKVFSQPRSANETLVAGAIVLKDQTSEWVSELQEVPPLDFSVVSTALESNPITGSQWTNEDANNLKFGIDVTIKPKHE